MTSLQGGLVSRLAGGWAADVESECKKFARTLVLIELGTRKKPPLLGVAAENLLA